MKLTYIKSKNKFNLMDIDLVQLNIILNSTLSRIDELSKSITEIKLIIPETDDHIQKKNLKLQLKYLEKLKTKILQDVHKAKNSIPFLIE